MKRFSTMSMLVILATLTACAPIQKILSPAGTAPGTEMARQVATLVAEMLTQTAAPAATTPLPDFPTLPSDNPDTEDTIPFKSDSLGILFRYPAAWQLREGDPSQAAETSLTSFDPEHPPHKLEWTDQSVRIQFRTLSAGDLPQGFDAWVESAKQAALEQQLEVYAEESEQVANQPAAHLTLVSGSGGIIHRVLTIVDGRYMEIDIEGNYALARAVLDSVQPLAASGLKPAEGDTPAAGICGEPQGDIIEIVLGTEPGGLPKAGRCVVVQAGQRIKLINQTGSHLRAQFGEFAVDLVEAGEMLLDKPVGDYLATGTHFLPMGPVLWLKAPGNAPGGTGPSVYSNAEIGYTVTLPPGWMVDEFGLANSNREVIFYPPNAEPFVSYLSISLDGRSLDQIAGSFAQNAPDATREETDLNGLAAIRYTYPSGRSETYVVYGSRTVLAATDRPQDGDVQAVLLSLRFTSAP